MKPLHFASKILCQVLPGNSQKNSTSGCPLSRGNVLKCEIFLHKIEKQIKDAFVHNSTTATTDFHFKFCKKQRTFIYKEKDFPFIIFIFLTIIIIISSRRKKIN